MSFVPPPQLNRRECVPLPRQYDHPVTLNPLLQRLVNGAGIAWTVSESPSTAHISMLNCHGDDAWHAPATTPPLNTLTIWWTPMDRPIVVRPKKPHVHHQNVYYPYVYQECVTVKDVICAVYDAIRYSAQMSVMPYHSLISPPPFIPALSETQTRDLMLQFMNGRFIWDGLSRDPREPELWVLHVR